ncbi:response regulator transcription factor [Pseudoneobacillus sp. C159]
MKKGIVLIDENRQNCKKFLQFFEPYFMIDLHTNGLQGLISAVELRPSVVVINHSLLNVNSLELCRSIRQQLNTIIIIVGDDLGDEDIVKYYRAGANDVYLGNQLNYAILHCKINVMLNLESHHKIDEAGEYRVGELVLRKENFKVEYEDKELGFTKKEFSILWYLAEKQGSVVSREDLIKGVWSYAHLEDDRMIDTHLNRIRKKFKQYHIDLMIKTVWGIGYTLQTEGKNEATPLKRVAK